MIHVIPINDDREHCRSLACWCKPIRRIESGQVVMVHNADDRREWVEREIGEGVGEDKQWGVFED